MEVDIITCHDKEDAKNVVDAIGGENIQDFEYLENGQVRIILNCKCVDIPGAKKCK